MGDKDDRLALVLPFLDQLEQALDLSAVEAGGRLVEDDQPRVEADRL